VADQEMLISTLTSSTLLHRCPGISNSCQDQFKLQFIIPEEKPSSQLKNANKAVFFSRGQTAAAKVSRNKKTKHNASSWTKLDKSLF